MPVLVQINTRHEKQKNFRERLLERLNRLFFWFFVSCNAISVPLKKAIHVRSLLRQHTDHVRI